MQALINNLSCFIEDDFNLKIYDSKHFTKSKKINIVHFLINWLINFINYYDG